MSTGGACLLRCYLYTITNNTNNNISYSSINYCYTPNKCAPSFCLGETSTGGSCLLRCYPHECISYLYTNLKTRIIYTDVVYAYIVYTPHHMFSPSSLSESNTGGACLLRSCLYTTMNNTNNSINYHSIHYCYTLSNCPPFFRLRRNEHRRRLPPPLLPARI